MQRLCALTLAFTLVGVTSIGYPARVSAQDPPTHFTIVEQDGQIIDPNGKTRLVFETEDGERVPISLVLEREYLEGSGLSWSGSSVFVSGRGERTREICMAPCTIEIGNGVYALRAGELNPSFDVAARFSITANGGSQRWHVEEGSPGLLLGGALILGTGISFALVGAGLIPLGNAVDDSTLRNVGLGGIAIGIPLIPLGWWMTSEGPGSAEMLK
ncbi:MAG: hypothetical protein AAFX99_04090 [Myxococcota bacterium]